MRQIKNLKNKKIKTFKETPKIKSADPVVLELWVKAGGRCEFHGCNNYLLQDKLTTNEAKVADIGHIIARSKDGPRGNDLLPLEKRNHISNLILLCPTHHRLVDRKKLEKKFPKELLQKYKNEHENRIKYLTGLGPEHETVVIRMIGCIRGNSVSVSNEEIRNAILECDNRYPRYLGAENNIEIDLTGLPSNVDKSYWRSGKQKIDEVISRLIIPAIDRKEIRHLSIFALTRIPFLIYFGSCLGDKVPIEVYQKQRSGKEGWAWRKDGEKIKFDSVCLQKGIDTSKVALVVSLSGKILKNNLPLSIDSDFSIYEICPLKITPHRNIMQRKENLSVFRDTYQHLLRRIEKTHKKAKTIHLFPAISISTAIVCGREMLKDISPSLKVYDVDKKKNFKLIMEVK